MENFIRALKNLNEEFTTNTNKDENEDKNPVLTIKNDKTNRNTYYSKGKSTDYALNDAFTRNGKKIDN